MDNLDLEVRVRKIIENSSAEVDSAVRTRERELSELIEMRVDHAGNFFFVRRGAPKEIRNISSSDTVVVDGLYDWKRPRKRARYLQLKSDATYKGPIMVAEGDSWFEHPLFSDLIDLAGKEYAVLSLAKAGDTWRNIWDEDSDPPKLYPDGTLMGLVHAVTYEDTLPRPPGTVLLSAGGNDIIGQISRCVYDYNPSRPANKYINHYEFDQILGYVLDDYGKKSADLAAKGKTVIVYSYDYPNPQDNGPYIGLPLQRDRNIPGVGLMRQIVNQMIDLLSDGLMHLSSHSSKHVHFVDLRGTIGTTDYLNGPNQNLWSDEMHGNDQGFALLWNVLHAGIKKYAH
jgi:metacaspase-1